MESPVSEKTYNVLFLCRHNSARSIMAESLLRKWGRGRFTAFSAGSHPAEKAHPSALALLEAAKLDTSGLRPKSWDNFSGPDAPTMDFVITVCEATAAETRPVWPGGPMTTKWSVEDPAAVPEARQARAFRNAFLVLEARVKLFTALRVETLDALVLKRSLDDIGDQGETGS